MNTINYKGHYIHGYVDKTLCNILVMSNTGQYTISGLKSLHAAKCYISKKLILK